MRGRAGHTGRFGVIVVLLGWATAATPIVVAGENPATAVVTGPSLELVALTAGEAEPALYLVDPMIGELGRTPVGASEVMPTIVATSRGILFASIEAADGQGTDVVAMAVAVGGISSPTPIGHVPDPAAVWALSPAGDRLWLMTFADRLPSGATSLPLPERWHHVPPAPELRCDHADQSKAVPDPDLRWYGLDGGRRLWMVTVCGGGEPSWIDLGFTVPSAYSSVLPAPNGEAVYVVDYFAQTISVIAVSSRSVVQTIQFGRERFKRPTCAATLSRQGDRLYVLANAGNVGDGILVFDTTTWQQLDHLLPGTSHYCLTVSGDGHRLYTSDAGALTTIDLEGNTPERTVALTADDCCPYLLGTVTAVQ